MISCGLRSYGYRVLEAGDGLEALELASQYPDSIDLLVTDVHMPRLDGVALSLSLQQSRPGVKVLYVSGDPNEALADDRAFLPKPFTISSLLSKIDHFLPTSLIAGGPLRGMKRRSSLGPPHSDTSSQATRILIVSPSPGDHQFLAEVLVALHASASSASSFQEACERVKLHSFAVVVTEKELPDGTWKDIQRLLDVLRPEPLLIVASIAADEYLWAEVLNTGGFDVLAKPFGREETIHSISHALFHYRQHRGQSSCAERGVKYSS